LGCGLAASWTTCCNDGSGSNLNPGGRAPVWFYSRVEVEVPEEIDRKWMRPSCSNHFSKKQST